MRWQAKLTKAEMKHVRQWVGNTLQKIKANTKTQQKMRRDDPTAPDPCYICHDVGRKLGLI